MNKKLNEIEFKKQMKIIRLGIGPMIGSSRLFLSLLGLRPGRFRWKMEDYTYYTKELAKSWSLITST